MVNFSSIVVSHSKTVHTNSIELRVTQCMGGLVLLPYNGKVTI